MLEFIRSRAQGFFVWVIVGGIIITFALFGINQYFSGGRNTGVATVDGASISSFQLERVYAQQRQRIAEMFGGKVPEAFGEKMLKQRALEQLITQEVMIQAAMQNGMRVGNEQLAQMITTADVFKENGKFSNDKYEQLLKRQGMSTKQFENGVRRDILAAMFESGFRDTEFVTRAEENNLLRLKNQQRQFGYLTVALAPFDKKAKVTDTEIKAFYDVNSRQYMVPEQVKIDYLELNVADLAKSIKVDDDTLRSRYEAQKINYSTPEERRASHILITAAKDAPEADVQKAKKKAEAILARVRGGEDFAKVAKAESQDPGSAKKGGDLDFFGKGAMVPPFEEATYKLKKGEISGLVRSDFGFHIIKLTDIRGGKVKPFDKVKDTIRKEVQNEKAEQQFYDMAEKLENLTYEHPESLRSASDALKLPIKTSAFFPRQGGTGIASNAKISSAAFSDDVLLKGNNSASIELERNHLVVLRVNEHKEQSVKPLKEVKEQISKRLKRERAEQALAKKTDELLKKIASGTSAAKLAKGKKISWTKAKLLSRDAKGVDNAILQKAFSMPHPAKAAVSDKVAMASGDQAIIVLSKVTDGDPAKADANKRKQIHDELQGAQSNAAKTAVASGIRARMDIHINQ